MLPALLLALLDRQADGHSLYRPVHRRDGTLLGLTGVYMNPVGLAMRGFSADNFIGSDLLTRTRANGNPDAADAYQRVAVTGQPMERRIVSDDQSGVRRAYEVNGARVPTGDNNQPWLLSLSFRDVTHELDGRRRLERTAADLERLARTDPLTGLLNRRGWQPALSRAVRQAQQDEHSPHLNKDGLCVAIADLDRFKDYNDSHGHLAGDQLLCEVTRRWVQELTDGQELARLGGEEFALLLPHTELDAAIAACDRLRALVPSEQTVSIGLTAWCPDELPEATLGRADAALYSAKRAGRNRVVALLAPHP